MRLSQYVISFLAYKQNVPLSLQIIQKCLLTLFPCLYGLQCSVPAVIGLQGTKIKDTQLVTNTIIHLKSNCHIFHSVSITGSSTDNCQLAKRIICHATGLHLASLKENQHSSDRPGKADESRFPT